MGHVLTAAALFLATLSITVSMAASGTTASGVAAEASSAAIVTVYKDPG